MLKTKKNQKNLFLFLKLILFSGVVYLLYARLSGLEAHVWESFELKHVWALVLGIVLVVPNIWIAYKKWTYTMQTLELEASPKVKLDSFFAGIVTGLLTPNMIGNFLGRFYYFPKEKRGMITGFTILSNVGQYLASITFGAISVFAFQLSEWEGMWYLPQLLIGLLVFSYAAFFLIDRLASTFKRWGFTAEFRRVLKQKPLYRPVILLMSYGRFFIFTLQFSFVLYAFGADWNFELVAAIWKVYLITMLVPSLFFGKIGVKEYIALTVLGAYGLNEVSILIASLIIWFVNTVSPALLGLIICKNKEEARVD